MLFVLPNQRTMVVCRRDPGVHWNWCWECGDAADPIQPDPDHAGV